MDINLMHTVFREMYDKIDSVSKPVFQSVEIDIHLNTALDRFYKQRYGANNIHRKGFEESQKRIDDLRPLVFSHRIDILNPAYFDTINKTYLVPISQIPFYRFHIASWLELEYLFCNKIKKTEVACRFIQHDDYILTKDSSITAPSKRIPYILFYNAQGSSNDVIEIDTGAENFNEDGNVTKLFYNIRYLSIPKIFGLITNQYPYYLLAPTDCPLAEYTHQEIVELAVSLCLEEVEQPRYQSFQTVINSEE